MSARVEVRDLAIRIGERTLAEGLSMQAAKGELWAVLGAVALLIAGAFAIGAKLVGN